MEPYIATPRDVLAAIDRCYGASETMNAARRFTREREQLRGNIEEITDETDISDAPIVQLVRSLIEQQSAREQVISTSKRLNPMFAFDTV